MGFVVRARSGVRACRVRGAGPPTGERVRGTTGVRCSLVVGGRTRSRGGRTGSAGAYGCYDQPQGGAVFAFYLDSHNTLAQLRTK